MRFCGSGELCKVNRAIGSPDDFLHIKNEIENIVGEKVVLEITVAMKVE